MQALQKNANNTSNTYVHVKQVRVIKVRHIIQIMQVIHLKLVHLVFDFRVFFLTEDILHFSFQFSSSLFGRLNRSGQVLYLDLPDLAHRSCQQNKARRDWFLYNDTKVIQLWKRAKELGAISKQYIMRLYSETKKLSKLW